MCGKHKSVYTPVAHNAHSLITSLDHTQFRVLQYHFVRPWALETHGDYPEAFRAAARTMLLAAKRVGDEDAVGLWSLPRDTVLHILKHAAEPLHAWFSEEAAVNAPA